MEPAALDAGFELKAAAASSKPARDDGVWGVRAMSWSTDDCELLSSENMM